MSIFVLIIVLLLNVSSAYLRGKMNNRVSSIIRHVQEGSTVPKDVSWKIGRYEGPDKIWKWDNLTYDDIFKSKRIILFGLPGAFTPTCSSSHAPNYNKLAKYKKDLNIHDIYCISVNDPFVMTAWQEKLNAYNIKFIPDGNGEFTKKLGFLVDKSNINFSHRSWRYSIVVNDGIIEKLFLEENMGDNHDGDPFEVSDAFTMETYLMSKL
eukprot:GHVL01013972.1.p1 GENE.GHVL01013972.1~~GHVL01013972.1.p1  ORF type:complete len:219 (+),score=55.71 GHVL01013972.1:32-658(+)